MNKAIMALVCLMWIAVWPALGQEPSVKAEYSVKSMPPSVVKTVPMSGDQNVRGCDNADRGYVQQADDGRKLVLGADIEGHVPADHWQAEVSG